MSDIAIGHSRSSWSNNSWSSSSSNNSWSSSSSSSSDYISKPPTPTLSPYNVNRFSAASVDTLVRWVIRGFGEDEKDVEARVVAAFNTLRPEHRHGRRHGHAVQKLFSRVLVSGVLPSPIAEREFERLIGRVPLDGRRHLEEAGLTLLLTGDVPSDENPAPCMAFRYSFLEALEVQVAREVRERHGVTLRVWLQWNDAAQAVDVRLADAPGVPRLVPDEAVMGYVKGASQGAPPR